MKLEGWISVHIFFSLALSSVILVLLLFGCFGFSLLCAGSLAAAGRALFVVFRRLLTAVALLVEQHRCAGFSRCSTRAQQLRLPGS